MRVLIIALPRTGSTSLLYQIAKDRGLKAAFEPFKLSDNYMYSESMNNIVVKTIVEQHPDNFYLANQFDEVILLSRKNYKEHVESLAYLYHNIPSGYNSNKHYEYIPPPKEIIRKAASRIIEMNNELEILSNRLEVPIQYYEDLFDKNSPEKLRLKNIQKRLI